ncbi:unnamed protein product, partial [Polarella glacialis]
VCRLLLEEDEGLVMMTNLDQMTPLHEAARLGRTRVVSLLLPALTGRPRSHSGRPGRARSGPDVRAGNSLRTPLHLACSRRHLETSALLLSAHADPQVACGLGRTALHYACAGLTGPRRVGFGDADGCLLELCHLLLRCRPNCRRLRDSSGRTPAELAADGGHLVPELKLLLCDNVAVSTPKAPSARRLSGKRQTKKIMSATG